MKKIGSLLGRRPEEKHHQHALGMKDEDDEETPLLEDEDQAPAMSCVNVYEPLTKKYRSETPTPVLLILMHMGTSLLEITELMSGYCFLLVNARTTFPKCGEHRVLDKLTGMDSGHGWLCEGSSIALWTFPLSCCIFVLYFHYWDFCDTRLFYEGLRSQILIHFKLKPFFTHPAILAIFIHFALGLSVFIFGAPSTHEGVMDMARGIVPFLLPICSFMVTLYVTWDIKFFLITLSKFHDIDPHWAKDYLNRCEAVTEHVVMLSYLRLKKRNALPVGQKSSETFGAIRAELMKLEALPEKELHQELDENEDGMMSQILALLFWVPGYWVLDLLWLPNDLRGKQFRAGFRTFGFLLHLVEIFVVYLIACTVFTYMVLQEHIHMEEWGLLGRLLSLQGAIMTT